MFIVGDVQNMLTALIGPIRPCSKTRLSGRVLPVICLHGSLTVGTDLLAGFVLDIEPGHYMVFCVA